MLSLSKISSSNDAVNYYARYALDQGEAEGRWLGMGARSLGLSGQCVREVEFRNLLSGLDLSGVPLIKESDRHTPGWDLTFSAPKSVSIAWSIARDEVRFAIEKAQASAVEDALNYAELHSSFSRTGKAGKDFTRSMPVAGSFQHSSNRDKEPQLHTHLVVCNVAQGLDGKWRTLDSRHVYRDQKAISSVYKLSLSGRLAQMGFAIERTEHSFEISGVPEEVRRYFSSRSMAVENELKTRGIDRESASRELKEAIVLMTRQEKRSGIDVVENARDFSRWQLEARSLSFSSESVDKLLASGHAVFQSPQVERLDLADLIQKSVDEVTAERSVFEGHHLHSKMAEGLIGQGTISHFLESLKLLRGSEAVCRIGADGPREKFSTHEMIDIERRVYREIRRRSHEAKHVVREKVLATLLREDFASIQDEQLQALRAAATSRSGVTIIQGVAGAGKSYTMRAVKSAFERDGYFVVGAAPTNKAARELQESTAGLETSSIDSLLGRIERGSLLLGQRSVLIVDEAGMVGSRKFEALLSAAGRARSKVILLGDSRQIQPIEAGQIFGAVHRRFGSQELRMVVRQKGEEAKVLLSLRSALSESEALQVLQYLKREERLTVGQTSHETSASLVEDYLDFVRKNPGLSPLVIASMNQSVSRLNVLIRDGLKARGDLQSEHLLTARSGRTIGLAVGDRIVFTDNKKLSGIYRSDFAKVIRVEGSLIEAQRSDGQHVRFDFRKFNAVEHGYAVTAHRAQGTTVDRAFVYADGPFMDREKTYVGLTRGRSGNRLYSDRESLGALSWEQSVELSRLNSNQRELAIDEIYKQRLAARIARSGEKDSTLNYTRCGAYFREQSRFSGFLDKLRDFGERLSGRQSVAVRSEEREQSALSAQRTGGR